MRDDGYFWFFVFELISFDNSVVIGLVKNFIIDGFV